MLPPIWQKITLFNPVVYLISGFRWSFYGVADVNVLLSTLATLGFLAACHGARGVDIPHRLQAQAVARGRDARRASPPRSRC